MDALRDLHMVMSAFNRTSLGKIVFGDLHGQRITEDEAILLGLWQAIACDRPDQARETLEFFVEDESIELLLTAMTNAVTKLLPIGLAPSGFSVSFAASSRTT